jgi:hypothetical protein
MNKKLINNERQNVMKDEIQHHCTYHCVDCDRLRARIEVQKVAFRTALNSIREEFKKREDMKYSEEIDRLEKEKADPKKTLNYNFSL